jgi:hypothetical protein
LSKTNEQLCRKLRGLCFVVGADYRPSYHYDCAVPCIGAALPGGELQVYPKFQIICRIPDEKVWTFALNPTTDNRASSHIEFSVPPLFVSLSRSTRSHVLRQSSGGKQKQMDQ